MTDSYFSKTAAEDKDYTIDWSQDLGTDNIATSNWSVVPAGLTITSPAPSKTSTTATVWTSGGTPGQNYLVTNTITTVGSRELEQRLVISINPPGN